VLFGGHERQRRVRLGLAARREDHLATGGELAQLLERHQDAVGHTEVAEIGRDRHVPLHAHAQQGDAPARAGRQGEHLLDAVDVRGEGRDDDAPGRAVESRAERLAHVRLRSRVAGPVHVGGIGAEHEHALVTQLGESPIVRRLAVQRARVELEVAGVHDGADGRADRQADAVRDRVRHADGLDAERAGLDAVARANHPEVRRLGEPVLAQSLRDERQRQGRAVHRHRRLAEQIGQGADVVLVAVGQDDGAEPLAPGERVRKVGDDVVDTG